MCFATLREGDGTELQAMLRVAGIGRTHSTPDLYLRIAPELFLERCVVGGIERVFEIDRSFRNEDIDPTHSPEFAMLEAYQACATYDDMAELTQALVVASAAAGTPAADLRKLASAHEVSRSRPGR